jgi:hypothetical protein
MPRVRSPLTLRNRLAGKATGQAPGAALFVQDEEDEALLALATETVFDHPRSDDARRAAFLVCSMGRAWR